MLIATIIASALSVSNAEARILSTPKLDADCAKINDCDSVDLTECIEQIESILMGFRSYYFDLNNNNVNISPDLYDKLISLESFWKGRSALVKEFWDDQSELIKLNESAEAFSLLRRAVVVNVQLHRAIQNVSALYSEKLGYTKTVSETNFALTSEFWKAATDASNQAYGRH